MASLAGPYSNARAPRTLQTQARNGGPVFGVGMRAFIRDASGRKGLVVLNDVSGKVALGHLADGAEVEILAWIPRRAATLYRVQSTEDRVEGWLGVANLRAEAPIATSPEVAPTAPVWISLRAPGKRT